MPFSGGKRGSKISLIIPIAGLLLAPLHAPPRRFLLVGQVPLLSFLDRILQLFFLLFLLLVRLSLLLTIAPLDRTLGRSMGMLIDGLSTYFKAQK